MPTPKWRRHISVIQQLLDKPYRFEFFQAVRLLERWYAHHHPKLRISEVVPSHLRFRNHLSLSFPPSEIAALAGIDKSGKRCIPQDDLSLISTIHELKKIEITPAFLGLLGSQGALPLTYTETITAREHVERDFAAREFLDIFTNRACALFYLAWQKYRLPFRSELASSTSYMPHLLALAGLENPSLRHDLTKEKNIHDQSLAFYSKAIGHRPISAVYLQQMLGDYFKVNVVIEQFVGKWFTLPLEQRALLGKNELQLGGNAMVGRRIWQRDLRLRLRIGVLRQNEFIAFLPGGKKAQALASLLALLAGVILEYEIRLILHKDDVLGTTLGQGNQLGLSTFINTRSEQHDREDACYELQPSRKVDLPS